MGEIVDPQSTCGPEGCEVPQNDSSSQPNVRYDIAIIGSGSAAFATAISATRSGGSVIMIEEGLVGGTCVNVGCVPSKALLAAAEARHVSSSSHFPGITSSPASVEMKELIQGKGEIVEKLRREKYEDLSGVYGFEIVHGRARFVEEDLLEVDGRTMDADYYVIATGATTAVPPIHGISDVRYLTSTTAMELDHVPRHLVVIGGNAVGLEQSLLFSRLGAKVTVIEAFDRIAPFEEPEISASIREIFEEENISVITGAKVDSVENKGLEISVNVTSADGELTIEADEILIATGRRPNSFDLGLEKVGVKTGSKGEIVVNEELRTDNGRIFAAGDVTGHPQFVYVAGVHGSIIVENSLRKGSRKVDYRTLPRIIFTTPQIASVGLTEDQAKSQGFAVESRVLPLSAVPRAIVNRDTRGLVKMVAEVGSGRILGISMIADGAADSILAGVYAMEANFTVDQVANIWTPYLVMAEAIKLTAQSFTRDVAELSCCAV